MRFRLLGRSGLRVSELCLGTMGFGAVGFAEKWGTDQAASRSLYDTFREVGGNFIDTANTYGNGASESYLGDFIAGDRDSIVLMTKYTGSYLGSNGTKDPNRAGSHRKSLRRAIEGSLKRLRTEYIDILCVHSWDFLTPLEEVMQGLDDLVRRGAVLYLGISNTPAWIVSRANTLAQLRGLTPFTILSAQYNLLERDGDRELLPMARALDIAVAAWTPLASGFLTGKYGANESQDEPRRLDDPQMGRFVSRTSERNLAVVAEVCAVAREVGCRPAHVALNWLRQHDVIPMLGARTSKQIAENAQCFEFELSRAQLQRLDEVSKIKLGYPHDFLASGIVRKFTYGGMREAIVDHRQNIPL